MRLRVIEKRGEPISKFAGLKVLRGMGNRENDIQIIIDTELRHEYDLVELEKTVVERFAEHIVFRRRHERNNGHRDELSFLVDENHEREDIFPRTKAATPAQVIDSGEAMSVRFEDGFDTLVVMANGDARHAATLAGPSGANKR